MDKNVSDTPKQWFIRLPQVLEIFPVSKSTLWKMVRENKFPRPRKLSMRTSAWVASEVYEACERLSALPNKQRSMKDGGGHND